MRFRKDADYIRRQKFEQALENDEPESVLEELAKSAKLVRGKIPHDVFLFTHPIPIIRLQEAEWFCAAVFNSGVAAKLVAGEDGIMLQAYVRERLDVEILHRRDFGDDACKSGLARYWFGGRMPPDPRERDIEEDTIKSLKSSAFDPERDEDDDG